MKGSGALWNFYTNHVRKVILPNADLTIKDITYWRNEIFFNILVILAPVSTIAVVPGVFMSFKTGIPALGIVDLAAFGLLVITMTLRIMPLKLRKSIFIILFYCLSITLLYYLGATGPGLLFLLATTIFAAVIYSSSAAYYIAWANTFICICLGILISLKTGSPIASKYDTGTWIAVSSNLVLLSFVCAGCLNLLLEGLKSSLDGSKTLAANLSSITESSDALIYSLDNDFRYITFNLAMKTRAKQLYNIEIKTGALAFEFTEVTLINETNFWEDIYTEALKGKPIRFEKDFDFGEHHSTMSFSLNPIIEDDKVRGVSCFASDITESKLAEKERGKLMRDLQLQNDELEQFAYVASHDLQEPLRMISSFMAQLEKRYGETLDERGKQYIYYAVDGAKRMQHIILDLLDFSRIGKMEDEMDEIDINTLVNDVLALYRKRIHEIDGKILFENLPTIKTYKTPVRQVFQNLISNALKYHKTGVSPVIEISCTETSTHFQFSVKDNGIGISAEYFDKIFIIFQRLHNKDEYSGTGIGLAIVKKTIENLGGEIWVESILGEGSTFYFTLLKNN